MMLLLHFRVYVSCVHCSLKLVHFRLMINCFGLVRFGHYFLVRSGSGQKITGHFGVRVPNLAPIDSISES